MGHCPLGVRLDDHRHRTRPNSYSSLSAICFEAGSLSLFWTHDHPAAFIPLVHLPLLCRPATPASTSQADGLRFRLLAAAAACCSPSEWNTILFISTVEAPNCKSSFQAIRQRVCPFAKSRRGTYQGYAYQVRISLQHHIESWQWMDIRTFGSLIESHLG